MTVIGHRERGLGGDMPSWLNTFFFLCTCTCEIRKVTKWEGGRTRGTGPEMNKPIATVLDYLTYAAVRKPAK